MFLDQQEFFPERYSFYPGEELSFDNSKIPTDTFTGIEFGLFPTSENQDTELKTQDLREFTGITSQIPELTSTSVIYGGQTSETNSWLGSIGSAISGFASGVGSVITGVGSWIGEKVGEAVDWVKGAGSWVIDKVSTGIDSFLKDPLGTTFGVIKGAAETVYNTASGIATWVMQNPWQALAIVGLAAFALTGIGAIAGAGWVASAGSFLFNAELLATGGLLAYKTATGTITTEDLVLGGLSLGPLAVTKAFQLTGITASLAPHVSSAVSRVGHAIGQSRIAQKISSGFSKITKAAGRAASKVEDIFEERMLSSWIKGTKKHLDPALANKLDELWASHKAGTHGALKEIKDAKEIITKGINLNAKNINKVDKFVDKSGVIREIEYDFVEKDLQGTKFVRESKAVDPNKFKNLRDMERWVREKIEQRIDKIMEAKAGGAESLRDLGRIEISIPKAAEDNIDFMTLLGKQIINLEKQYGIKIKLMSN